MLLLAYRYYTVTCHAFVYTSRNFLLRWFCCRPSITMLCEHSSQAYIGRIYASPPVLSSISKLALILVSNCRVCKCTVCSGSSIISPRMFIIMRPTLCDVRPKTQLRKRTRVPQWKICTPWGWKDVLSLYYECIYVHGMFTYVEIWNIKATSACEIISNVRHAKIVKVNSNNPSMLAHTDRK